MARVARTVTFGTHLTTCRVRTPQDRLGGFQSRRRDERHGAAL